MQDQMEMLKEIREYVRKYGHDRESVIDELNERIIKLDKNMNGEPEPIKDGFFCFSKVVGTTFREKDLGHPLPWDQFQEGDMLMLIPEPDNKVDKNAIKVMWTVLKDDDTHDVLHIGYIPKETAISLSTLIKDGEGKVIYHAVIASLTGGTEGKDHKGINIKIMFENLQVSTVEADDNEKEE